MLTVNSEKPTSDHIVILGNVMYEICKHVSESLTKEQYSARVATFKGWGALLKFNSKSITLTVIHITMH